MRTRWILGTICLGAILAAAQTPTAAPGNDSIQPADLEADVRFLAGDHMQGRQTGTPGNRQAPRSFRHDSLGSDSRASDRPALMNNRST